MKRTSFFLIIFFISQQILFAQEEKQMELSLEKCIKIAVDRNINTQTARIEQEKSEYKISENRAALLPKINASANFQDYFKLPTTLLPGEIVGLPGTKLPVEMGTTFNTSIAATLNIVLYNQTAITALQLSKKLADLSKLGVEKASEEIALEVAKLYYLTIITAEQKSTVEGNIVRTGRLLDITKILVDNGMSKQVDHDRVSVNIENLYSQLSSIEAAYEQQINMIKYMLDVPISQIILLTDKAETLLISDLSSMSDFSEHIDIKMLEQQKEVYLMNQKLINNGYIPSLSLTGQLACQGMRDEFKNYFNNNPENKWYGSSYIGFSLSIPVFDGLEKRSKSNQAKLDYHKAEIQLEDTKEKLMVNYQNAMNNYQNNKSNVERQKKNIELAIRVYDETALKYKEGLSSMSNLLQDEMSLNSAQASYLTALYNFKESELKLMSLNGEINKYFNE